MNIKTTAQRQADINSLIANSPSLFKREERKFLDGYQTTISDITNDEISFLVKNHRLTYTSPSRHKYYELTIIDNKTNKPTYDTDIHKAHRSNDIIPNLNLKQLKQLIDTYLTNTVGTLPKM